MVNHEIKEGQVYRGYHCDGFDWVVAWVAEWRLDDTDIFGRCQNPDCPDYDKNYGEGDPWRGVQRVDVNDFEEWLNSLEAVQS